MPIHPNTSKPGFPAVTRVRLDVRDGVRRRWIWYMLVALITTLLPLGGEMVEEAVWPYVLFASLVITIVLWEGNSAISDWLDEKISWLDHPVYRVLAAVVLQTVYSSIATIVASQFITFLWGTGWMDEEYRNNPFASLPISLAITAIITLVLTSRSFFLYLRASLIETEQLKTESLQLRVAALKTQLNPHFLFNSLNVLSSLVDVNPRQAQEFIQGLSQIYRYVLDAGSREWVLLEEEWRFIESYLRLLKIRFGEPLQYHLADSLPQGACIVPLTLQVLVENAIKHNVITLKKPLLLEILLQDHSLVVRNTLQVRNQTSEASGIGLANIREQYRHLTGKEVVYGVQGAFFEVIIPIIFPKENDALPDR